MKRSEEDVGWKTLNVNFKENEFGRFGHVKHRDENSILRRVMEQEVEGRRYVGRPKKIWSKIET